MPVAPDPHAPEPSHAADGLPERSRNFANIAIWLALLMAVVDTSIANVALPAIAVDLRAPAVQSVWIVNAYQLAIVVSLLPLASLGEIVTFRRVFLSGLGLFVGASILCSFARSVPELALARALQGFGAAGVMAVNGALVRHVYPSAMLGRGIGLNALVISIASVVGPSLASVILSVASWRWLFVVNVPLGLAALAVGLRALPENPRSGARLDGLSVLLNILAYGGVVFGLDLLRPESGRHGAVLPGLALAAAGLASGFALVRRALRQKRPLVPVDLLRSLLFSLSILTSIASFATQMLAFVALPFFFQTVLHHGQVKTGLLMTAWPLATGIAAPIAGRLADRVPAAWLGGSGLALLAAGMLLLALLSVHAADAAILWRMALCGLGFGFFQAPNNRLLLSAAPKSRAGAAGGMLATARLTGQTTGVSLAALLLGVTSNGLVLSLWLGAAIAGIGSLVSLSRLAARPA